ncbi:MAG TPA: HAMP domain-containing sensor histidine kinase [Acidimicrobiia bacterium]|nr:HAMP domain-containing sensor histidine kinase [Acidimicrobiia bacterium]
MQDRIEILVSAVSVPMLVADYTPIITRFAGLTLDEIAHRLEDESELLTCLGLPVQIGASDEWALLYGFPYEDQVPDLVARHFSADAYPELRQHMIAQFLAIFQGVTSLGSEHKAPTLAGDVIVRSHWKASIWNDRPDYSRVVIVDLDVTDLRETERSLEEAIQAKDRLTAVIAHELRNPLTAVVGFSSILTSDWGDLEDETRHEMVTEIGKQLGDVSALLDDFLAGSQASIHVDQTRVALNEIFDTIDLTGVANEADPTLVVRGDAMRIRQIVRNLVRNASKYGGSRIRLGTDARDERVAIKVLDDGVGVSSDILERLFEPYSPGRHTGSLGLGLSVSRGLARQMNGDLRYFRDEPWTVFELELVAG